MRIKKIIPNLFFSLLLSSFFFSGLVQASHQAHQRMLERQENENKKFQQNVQRIEKSLADSQFYPENGAYYRIVNKYHADKGVAANLDAYGDHSEGRIYRSQYDGDYSKWAIVPTNSSGYYKIVNKYHADKGVAANLDAYGDHSEGRIYRSLYDSDNTKWKFVKAE